MPLDRPVRVLELRSVWGTGGGPEKTILLGAAGADRERVEVTVSYIRDQRDKVFALSRRAADLAIDYVEIVERHSFDPGVWAQLRRIVEERRIDIVHAHDYKTNLLAWLLSRRTQIVPLSTMHGWSGYTYRERLVYYPVDKRLLAWFPCVIAVSTKIKQELVRCGARPDRVHVILNAIDTATFRKMPESRAPVRKSLGFDDGHFVVGAVGRLEWEKRFDVLLEAFAHLVVDLPAARLVFVGEGSLRAALTEQTQRLGVSAACQFLGHRVDLPELYQAFDVLVQSSETEGTPNAVLEAMATETPLVATDVGGTGELARAGLDGLVVPKHDPSALTAAIRAVSSHPMAARERADSARKRVESELSFQSRTARLEGLYAMLASGRAKRDAT